MAKRRTRGDRRPPDQQPRSPWRLPPPAVGHAGGAPGPTDDELLVTAIEMLALGDEPRADRLIDVLVRGGIAADRCLQIDSALARAQRRVLAALADAGWAPRDLLRALRVRNDERIASTLIDAAAAWVHHESSAARPVAGSWGSQLDDLGADRWWAGRPWLAAAGEREGSTAAALQLAVRGLAAAMALPPLPGGPERRAGGAGIDDRVLEKVRGLLAKAESTTYPAEAEALSAKAQELMARHAIDAAAVEARGQGGDVEVRRIWLDRPYTDAKSLLLGTIADANRCRAVGLGDLDLVMVVGAPTDLDAVELLLASLLVQATAAMLAEGGRVDRSGTSRTRSFRRSFLLGYAQGIGTRLHEAADQAVAEADAGTRAAALPVLARRAEAVEETMATTFPHLRTTAVRSSSDAGHIAGAAAAERADLGGARLHRG